MLITPGAWKGRGRFLYQGESLGSVVELEFQASRDTHGQHLEGTISPETGGSFVFAVHVVEDDTGTFQVTASGGPALEGTAKLVTLPCSGQKTEPVWQLLHYSLPPEAAGVAGFIDVQQAL